MQFYKVSLELHLAMAIRGGSSLPGGGLVGGGSPNKVQKRGKEAAREKRWRLKVAVARRNKIPRVGQTIHDAGESHPHLLPNHRLRLQKAAWRHTDTCYALLKHWIASWTLPTWKSHPLQPLRLTSDSPFNLFPSAQDVSIASFLLADFSSTAL